MQFFAGANTRSGFVSFFDKILKNTENIYILKGTSGCGKSTLMRKIAQYAFSKGLKTDMIYCSGDPASLDGVIINKLSVAVVDGTAPHCMDPKYPLVAQTIVDLGVFADVKKLAPHRDKIIKITDEKSEKYSSAYKKLSACGEISDAADALVKKYYSQALAENRAARVIEQLVERSGDRKVIFASAFTHKGIVTLPAFGEVKQAYRVSDHHGLGSLFVTSVADYALELGMEHILCPNPLDIKKAESVYFPSSGVLVTCCDNLPATAETEKRISLSRFIDDGIKDVRLREKTLCRIRSELLSEAEKELSEARELHSEIENIYTPAMDFSALDALTDNLIKNIFA